LAASKKSGKNNNKTKQKANARENGTAGAGFGTPQIKSKTTTATSTSTITPTATQTQPQASAAEIHFEKQSMIVPPTREDHDSELPEEKTDNLSAAKGRKARRQKWGDRLEAVDQQQAETEELKAVFTQEFLQHELLFRKNALPVPKQRLIQISSSPLIFTIDDFIDPDLCRQVQSDGSGCFDLLYPEKLADLVFGGQESAMDGLLFNAPNSQEHDRAFAAQPSSNNNYPDGLHMDTNGQCLFRYVTCILYLNDIPKECGGATVFPLARCLAHDPALIAARRLLEEKIPHTRSRSVALAGLEPAAQLLESRVGSNFVLDTAQETTIQIQPQAGRLLIFFSRDDHGKEDPRAWHAGERIRGMAGAVTEKRILTLFKEVDYTDTSHEHSRVETTFENYLAPLIKEQRDLLKEKAL